MPQQQSQYQQRERVRIDKPNLYNVIIHNDDFTTMDFVVEILMSIFRHNEDEAYNIMMLVHKSGKGIAGTYSYDIAMTKKIEATGLAREEGFPLEFTVERKN